MCSWTKYTNRWTKWQYVQVLYIQYPNHRSYTGLQILFTRSHFSIFSVFQNKVNRALMYSVHLIFSQKALIWPFLCHLAEQCLSGEVRGTVSRWWWAIRHTPPPPTPPKKSQGQEMSNHSNKRSVQHISGMTLAQKREVHGSEWRLLIGEPKVTKKRPGKDGGGGQGGLGGSVSFYPDFCASSKVRSD